MRNLLILIIIFYSSYCWAVNKPSTFKISIYSFPQSLEPQKQSSSVSYLFQNIFRNLFIYKGQGILKPDMAEKCLRKEKGLIFQCHLRKNLKWSNGEKITAQDFVDTYKRILNPENQSQRPDFLFPIKNAKEIFEGKKKVSELSVKALSKNLLQFEFHQPDSEFEYNLSTFYLSPIKKSYALNEAATFLTNGPYKINYWIKGQSLSLVPDLNYPDLNISGQALRPNVDFIYIEEDSVSLRLYDKKELHFVRRLPTLLISKYQNRKDYYSLPSLRFDYLGFGPELNSLPDVRKSLALSLDFNEWQSLLSSVGTPGCPGFPLSWTEPQRACLLQEKKKTLDLKLKFNWIYKYSLQGGDDHRRTAEWLQSQWKKNLNINFQVRGVENKSYVSEIKKNPPTVFRKGLALDRPTCSGVMENFTSLHPENYIQNKSPQFDQLILKMRQTPDDLEKRKLCRKALDTLLNDYKIVPTGPYNISLLASSDFTGWRLNELNQLDLTELITNTPP